MWVLGAGSPDPKETRKPRETRTCPKLAEDTHSIRVSPGKDWAQAGEQESEGRLLRMARGYQGSPPFQHTCQELTPLVPHFPSVLKRYSL